MSDPAETVVVDAIVERKQAGLPRFVVVPAAALAAWRLSRTTTVELDIGGVALGRRSLKRWDASRWFLDLPEAACRRAGVDTDSPVTLRLRRPSEQLPSELTRLVESSAAASAAWAGLSDSQQRVLREHVMAAKRTATRLRRAAKGLGVAPPN